MLEVISLEDAHAVVQNQFAQAIRSTETIPLEKSVSATLANNIVSHEGIPAFNRSTVDGFAVCASDTFGCSDGLPALLELAEEIEMGSVPQKVCKPGICMRIPTGGQVPDGADAVVMLEYCEEYGDGTIGIGKPVAPGDNMVFAFDDVAPEEVLIPTGTQIQPHHVGTLASLGITSCEVYAQPTVGIISTGDEIIPLDQEPVASQMRDVNAPVLAACAQACGAHVQRWPIVPDNYEALLATVEDALQTCTMVLISGGSSAGQKDNTARVLAQVGEVLFHGIAVKPGKPTLCANAQGKAVFGLPGHPVAAYFMFLELVAPLLAPYNHTYHQHASLAEALPSNHGRTELVPVSLHLEDTTLVAQPIRSKSGLISQLRNADGYITIDRNQEGLAAGARVIVKPLAHSAGI